MLVARKYIMAPIYGTPNFTIILPGPCQAKCDFCYWKSSKPSQNYLAQLKTVLDIIPLEFTRLSLSGGEPTLSPYLEEVITVVRQRRDWNAVVLTTNGADCSRLYDLEIDHINISRHAEYNVNNWRVFGTRKVPSVEKLEQDIAVLNKYGKDVTINCTLQNQFDKESLESFLRKMHDIGATGVTFRKDQRKESIDPPREMFFLDSKARRVWSCDACRVWNNLYLGMSVTWKSSIPEPSIHYGQVYELIFHPNGRLTIDWGGKQDYTTVEGQDNLGNNMKIKLADGTQIECTPEEYLAIKDSFGTHKTQPKTQPKTQKVATPNRYPVATPDVEHYRCPVMRHI